MKACILCHGGVGASASAVDGTAAAAAAGAAYLRQNALDAVVEATKVLEDDPRFNAGTGANFRLDGRTIEYDAGVMDSRGRVGAIAAASGMRYPILLARAVLDSPHHLLAGEGANRLAQRLKLERRQQTPERTHEKYRRALEQLLSRQPHSFAQAAWHRENWRDFWNFDGRPPRRRTTDPTRGGAWGGAKGGARGGARGGAGRGAGEFSCDTVGAVARDSRGRFAVSNSTGGTTLMLYGRVGDSPLVGCGFFAGPAGAVTTTGVGEEIINRLLAFRVYQWMEEGATPQEACAQGAGLFPRRIPVGILAVNRESEGVAASREMPWAGVIMDKPGSMKSIILPS
ncbi:MAG: isoaspartyl peptidase/L-asparaginase [Candidatus Eisenbacteria bacterium]|uniref:Isoaspartyl peptidase/L-asparaginase n=1 Tax=Eiseniibacteriota bacterium TaxID=2212470 RepID=A0A948S2P3_UNCEI|nr:isoaspartyl peptidase/L-asparaginase [Candidatus Eisenbacteria bacterium]MBU1949822.1 isoaspartyl peptidase/L-asparaginase [Candidatus Eisenbacteria bacterium]MBU2692719.1 isoaspartyl peptidase/L-asparaginase [Candidatus Eisenbacteria bacterium]